MAVDMNGATTQIDAQRTTGRPRSVDLRSDTVTQPTAAMYQRILNAPLGDDALDGDPTCRELEEGCARLLGKEAALFVPSCTMANLLATLAHLQRGEQLVLESEAHMYIMERGAATFTGAFYAPIQGSGGQMDLELLEEAISQGPSSRLRTGMIALETSHNNAGGTVLPLPHMAAIQRMGAERGIALHLDGARLFNAAVYLQVTPAEISRYCDTVSLCLSKGLSAPMGAILAGPQRVIDKARGLRRMLGGQQRQVGIVAAAGIEAVTVMGGRLLEDHARARRLSRVVREAHPLLQATEPQTNIVQVDVSATGRSATEWTQELANHGLRVRPWSTRRLRCVTHRHIDDQDIEHAGHAFSRAAHNFNTPWPSEG
jgi:threonine aldolase